VPSSLDTASSPPPDEDLDSPNLLAPPVRARFEFEPGKGNAGTKILMLEWDRPATTPESKTGSWTVAWEGKTHILPAASLPATPTHRLFFLLPPRASIPPSITLTGPVDGAKWTTKPLPAIFPPGLYESALDTPAPHAALKRGVLHTLWAKKRLQTLAREIEAEKAFPEGVGLAMALREADWITAAFSLPLPPSDAPGTAKADTEGFEGAAIAPVSGAGIGPTSPVSPLLSPGGSRLTEKLKGLKLHTGGKEGKGILSPEDGDVAMPGLSALPPISAVPRTASKAVASLTGVLAGTPAEDGIGEEEEAGLFALPLSPRSPDMTKSPFSFAASDTMKYMR
ncbi:hypothetical protein EJ06DRAFT_466524, partial [Trichodelitschia bisporula]